jgi:hypothetical protein
MGKKCSILPFVAVPLHNVTKFSYEPSHWFKLSYSRTFLSEKHYMVLNLTSTERKPKNLRYASQVNQWETQALYPGLLVGHYFVTSRF